MPLGHRAPPSRAVSEPRPPSSRESSCNAFMPGCITTRFVSNSKLTGSARTRCAAVDMVVRQRHTFAWPNHVREEVPKSGFSAMPFLHRMPHSVFPLASLSCFVFVVTVPISADLRLLQREQVIHQFRPCVPFQLACKLAASEQRGAPAEAHGMQCPYHVGVRRGCCVGSCSAGVLRRRVHSEMVASSAPRVDLAGVLCVPYPSPCLRRSSAAAFALILNIPRGGFGLFAAPGRASLPSGMLPRRGGYRPPAWRSPAVAIAAASVDSWSILSELVCSGENQGPRASQEERSTDRFCSSRHEKIMSSRELLLGTALALCLWR
jgi:hypothetical protein